MLLQRLTEPAAYVAIEIHVELAMESFNLFSKSFMYSKLYYQ